ncbi:hypothetical protein P691DRAFT_780781 [Macrolepiota fuliginosa MF-IS2]|uniref:Uncharacterized protein n=1 Tax=Macrolepiota fuliginosa MF-IS2 TaxID=1400762 RepID=A0A9P5WXP6_9AGAR|nr:hypothetical protein P691DRAFT_780781 [Macrolepiota fuliginosa MF-IS2]
MAHIDIDLRHMTSAGHLSSQRSPRRARLGSRSPNSIPSSPTSVYDHFQPVLHSSSSAIFERDIEPVVPPSPPFLAHQNPHRIPRAKTTEQLEHAVPSVLASAASLLTTLDDSGETPEHVAVVTPAPASTSTSTSPAAFESILARGTSSGFASPIGSFRSRSPSPLGLRVATGAGPMPRTDLLLNIPPFPTATTSPHTTSSFSSPQSVSSLAPSAAGYSAVRPTANTSSTGQAVPPAIVTESGESSPATSTACEHTQSAPLPLSIPPSLTAPISQPTSGLVPMTSQPITALASPASTSWPSYSNSLSHPPSPTHGPSKRLSFMSYSDLLSSTPASTLPLSSLTTSASSTEPPPHIPSVSGLNIANASAAHSAASPGGAVPGASGKGAMTSSAATSLRGFVMGPMGGITHPGKRDSIAMSDDVGGEWEREGLGRGLEERLEALIALPQPQTVVALRT